MSVEPYHQGMLGGPNFTEDGQPVGVTVVRAERGRDDDEMEGRAYAKKDRRYRREELSSEEEDEESSSDEESDEDYDDMSSAKASEQQQSRSSSKAPESSRSNSKATDRSSAQSSTERASSKASAPQSTKSSAQQNNKASAQQSSKSSANAGNVTKSRTPFPNEGVNRGSAPMPSPSAGPVSKSSGHQGNALLAAYNKILDENLVPEDDCRFQTNIELVFVGTTDEFKKNKIVLPVSRLLEIFRPVMKNPDKEFSVEGYYKAGKPSNFFLERVSIVETQSNCTGVFALRCESKGLEYLNATPVVIAVDTTQKEGQPHGHPHSDIKTYCMHTVKTGHAVYQKGLVVADNTAIIGTQSFAKFGHLDVDSIAAEIIDPSDADVLDRDPRIRYPAHTQIARMIMREANKKELQLKFSKMISRGEIQPEEREGEIDVQGEYLRIGPKTFAEAISIFNANVLPKIRGKYDLNKELKFGLENITGYSSTTVHHVSVTLCVGYAYTKSSKEMMERAPVVMQLDQKRVALEEISRKLSQQQYVSPAAANESSRSSAVNESSRSSAVNESSRSATAKARNHLV